MRPVSSVLESMIITPVLNELIKGNISFAFTATRLTLRVSTLKRRIYILRFVRLRNVRRVAAFALKFLPPMLLNTP